MSRCQNSTIHTYPVVTAPAVSAAIYLCLVPPLFAPGQIAHAVVSVAAGLIGSVLPIGAIHRNETGEGGVYGDETAVNPTQRRLEIVARVCLGIALAALILTVRLPRGTGIPRYAIDTTGEVTVFGRAVEDLRPSATGTRALRIALDEVRDRRDWRGSARGEIVVLWDGPESLLAADGVRRLVPLRHDGIAVVLNADERNDTASDGSAEIRGYRWVSVEDMTVTPTTRRDVEARRFVRTAIRRRLARLSSSSRGVLAALILGDRRGLDRELSENVRKSGAAHILALSGMHLGVLAALLAVATRRLLPRGSAAVIGCVVLGWYVWVAGTIPSLLRAYAMVCVGAVATLRYRRVPPLVILARGIVVLCAIDPGITGELGFQYSVLALAGLLLLAPGVVAWGEYLLPRRVALYGGTSLAALLVTAPLSIALFGAFYPAGVIMAGVLSAVVVVQIWIGLVYIGVARIPVVGTVLASITEGVTAALARLAAVGAMVPGFDHVAIPAPDGEGIEIQQPEVIIVAVLLLVSLWWCVLLLRRRRRARWRIEGSRWNESHLDY
ncbi:MAG: ComEC/Rec2 family competence protein [Alkalispirochaeta sp.]